MEIFPQIVSYFSKSPVSTLYRKEQNENKDMVVMRRIRKEEYAYSYVHNRPKEGKNI